MQRGEREREDARACVCFGGRNAFWEARTGRLYRVLAAGILKVDWHRNFVVKRG